MAGSLGACSPGWFGSGRDERLASDKGYRTVNQACSGLEIRSAQVDADDYRAIVKCLNSNGALDPVVRLNARLTDADLQPLLDLFNAAVLKDSRRHAELDLAWRALLAKDPSTGKASVDALLAPFGDLLSRPELLVRLLRVVEPSYRKEPGVLLSALGDIGSRIEARKIPDWIDTIRTVSAARSWRKLVTQLSNSGQKGQNSAAIAAGLVGAAQDVRAGRTPDLLAEAVAHIADGRLLELLDQLQGSTPDEMLVKLPRNAQVFRVLLQSWEGRPAAVTQGLITLSDSIRAPLACLSSSMEVPDGREFALRELRSRRPEETSSFLRRKFKLQLAGFAPFCELPATVGAQYRWLEQLGKSSAAEEAQRTLQAVYAQGFDDFLIRLLTPSAGDGPGGLRRFLPLLSELNDRNSLEDAFLLLALPRLEDRADLQDAARFWLEHGHPALLSVLSQTTPAELAGLLDSMDALLNVPSPILDPLLQSFRASHFQTSTHPVTGWVREQLVLLPGNPRLLETFLRLKELPEFQESLGLFGKMASDGRLRDLIDTVLKLFRNRLAGHELALVPQPPAPGFDPRRRHDLSSDDLVVGSPTYTSSSDPCTRFDLSVGLERTDAPRFAANLDAFRGCLAQEPGTVVLADALGKLQELKLEDERTTLYGFSVDLVRKLGFTQAELRDLVDRFFRISQESRFDRWLKGLSLLVEGPKAVARPLLDLVGPPVKRARNELRNLLQFAGDLLAREDLPAQLAYLKKLSGTEPAPPEGFAAPAPAVEGNAQLQAVLGSALRYRECVDPGAVEGRLAQVYSDYREAINNMDLAEDGLARRSWTRKEFDERSDFFFRKFADPAQSSPEKSVVQALLNTLGYFRDVHYPVDYLGTWLDERSRDERPILYFYKGEKKPRIRLVNTLDRFELLLFNADFVYLIQENYGQKYLARLGRAWGDEDPSRWPAEIRKKYSRFIETGDGDRPETLRQAYEAMKKELSRFAYLAGSLPMPHCHRPADALDDGIHLPPKGLPVEGRLLPPGISDARARLFNLSQVLGVVEENLPDAQTPQRGGMTVLRDLFWELLSSSPEGAQGSAARIGDRNNLSVVSRLVKFGLMRQIGRTLRSTLPGEERARFFRNLVLAGTHPRTSALLETVFRQESEARLARQLLARVRDSVEKGDEVRARAADTAFHLVNFLDQPGVSLLDPVLETLQGLVHDHAAVLARHLGFVETVLSSRDLGNFVVALDREELGDGKKALVDLLKQQVLRADRADDLAKVLEAIDSEPVSVRAWNEVDSRWKALKASGDWEAQDMPGLLAELFDFLRQDRPGDVAHPWPARRVRMYLAERLRSRGGRTSDIELLLGAIARDPERFYPALRSLGIAGSNGDLRELIELARRSIRPASS